MSIHSDEIWMAMEELNTNAIIVVNNKGYIENTNAGVTTILGYSSNDLVGSRLESLLPDDVKKIHKSRFDRYTEVRQNDRALRSKLVGKLRFFPANVSIEGKTPLRFSIKHKNGLDVPISLTINEVWSQTGDLHGFIANIIDNSTQVAQHERLKYNEEHDQLTGLFSWQKFTREVHAVRELMRKDKYSSVSSLLCLDVDYFKVFALRPQKAVDSSLKLISRWLLSESRQEKNLSKDIILSRYLSDKFVLFLPGTHLDKALFMASRLKKGFKELNLGDKTNPFFTSLSFGAAEIDHEMRLQDGLSQATTACDKANRKGGDKIVVAEKDSFEHIRMEPLIRSAIYDKKLMLYAQKIVAISERARSTDKNLAHYEILCRMEDKKGNLISPAIFVPAAESFGLAIAMDRFIVEHTLSTLKKHCSGHERALSLCSINLSALSVANEHTADFIQEQIRRYGIDPGKISFEFTETQQILEKEVALKLIDGLRELGCKVALDDFGVGYSNFQSFFLPVDIIKIDGSYVKNCRSNPQLRTDIVGMINSAKSRDIEIVGEFAENGEIIEELINLGVDYAQGYYYGKPVPLETMIEEFTEKT